MPNTPLKIYNALQIGAYHFNHCEDYLYTGAFGKNKLLCAVMDGCTMALDSHFASALVGKILKKLCLEKSYQELVVKNESAHPIEQELKSLLKALLEDLKTVRNQLMLDTKELLTTLIIMLIDTATEEGIVLVIGDGMVSINGTVTEFEQDNKPDYLGFHLSDDFESFYAGQLQKITFDTIQDISIATDGIFTFEKMAKTKLDTIDVQHYLTADTLHSETEEMLTLKLKVLANQYGLLPTDDFSMIRIRKTTTP